MFNQLSRDIHLPHSAKKLSDLIAGVPVIQVYGPLDAPVAGITTDSRKADAAWIFVAVEGEHTDGHNFIQQAIERGASVVVIQAKQYEEYLSRLLPPAYAQHNQVTVLVVYDTRLAVARLASVFYGDPAATMKLIGITGTNGKTTTAHYIKSVLEQNGEKAGMIGTIEYHTGDAVLPASLTTPLAEEVHALLRRMANEGCSSCVMEVSSHSLALERVHGMMFDVCIFTNISRDHLDFHGTFEEYARTKSRLFKEHAKGAKIINTDDQFQMAIWDAHDEQTITYGRFGEPQVCLKNLTQSKEGLAFEVAIGGKILNAKTKLIGTFNACNATAAIAACDALGISHDVILAGIAALERVPGRFERVYGPDGILGVVDYSHTPDSLKKALVSARELLGGEGELAVVFGCGGDRDKGKRPQMGRIAEQNADKVYITNDNPRSEIPQDIIRDIAAGLERAGQAAVIPDRAEAIATAVRQIGPNGIVLVAGKGHETYQLTGSKKTHFDDREELTKAFDARVKER